MEEMQHKTSPLTWLVAMLVVAAITLGACGDDGGGDSVGPGDTGDSTGPTGDDATGTPWTDADFERLVAIEIDGYTLENPNVTEFGNATVSYLEEAPTGPVALSAFVTYQACDPFSCSDLSAEIDEQRRENARSLLPSLHIDNPDLVEEIGPVELAGRTALVIYFRSFVDQDDGQATANSYRAITHDGTNLVTVLVTPDFGSGGLADSAAELEERMDADAGAAVAAEILGALSAELD